MDKESTGRWFVVGSDNNEILGTRGISKEEATDALCIQVNMLKGSNNDWSFWQKRGYKVRKE